MAPSSRSRGPSHWLRSSEPSRGPLVGSCRGGCKARRLLCTTSSLSEAQCIRRGRAKTSPVLIGCSMWCGFFFFCQKMRKINLLLFERANRSTHSSSADHRKARQVVSEEQSHPLSPRGVTAFTWGRLV